MTNIPTKNFSYKFFKEQYFSLSHEYINEE